MPEKIENITKEKEHFVKAKDLKVRVPVMVDGREDRAVRIWPPDESGQIEISWDIGGWSADGARRIMSAKFDPEHEFEIPCAHEWVWEQNLGRPNGSFVRTTIESPSGDLETKEESVYNQVGICGKCGVNGSRTGTKAQLHN